MPLIDIKTPAAAGTTGNNTHTSVTPSSSTGRIEDYRTCFQFTISATGSTPTVDFKVQAAVDGSHFVDLILSPSDTDTKAVTFTKTAVGTWLYFIDSALDRAGQQYRLVTANNTNVTYNAELYTVT